MNPPPEGFSPLPMAPIRQAKHVPAPEPEEVAADRYLDIVAPGITALAGGAEIYADRLAVELVSLGWTVRLLDDPPPDTGQVVIWWGRVYEDHPKPGISVYLVHGPSAVQDAESMADKIEVCLSVARSCCPPGARVVRTGGVYLKPKAQSRREDVFALGILARNSPEKGHALAFDAIRLLPPSIILRCYGAPDLDIPEDLVGRVEAHPWVDADDALGWVDAVLVPSEFEGMPLAALDAVAAGIPLVHCGQGDLDAEFPGRSKAWRAGRTPGSIAEVVSSLVADRQEAQRRAEAARYNLRSMADTAGDVDRVVSAMVPHVTDTTVYLISSGESTTAQARAHLDAQSIRPAAIIPISNVAPMDRAFQCMIDTCTTKYYVQVDADMLLAPGALAALRDGIEAQGERCAEFVGYLWGDVENKPIQGVKIYRHAAMVQAPYEPGLSCEWRPMERLTELGYHVAVQSMPEDRAGCLGEHASAASVDQAFIRGSRLMQKLRAAPGPMAFFHDYPRLAFDRLRGDPTRENLALVAGVVAGLTGAMPEDKEMDASRIDPDLRRLNFWLRHAYEGPKELALYATSKCNQKCRWCSRTTHGAGAAPDITPAIVSKALAYYPTIRSVCIAGFGEPLMCSDIGDVVEAASAGGRHVAMVSNGTLLESHAEALAAAGLRSVDVSLNACDGEEYQLEAGVDLFDAAVRGVRAALAAGLHVCVSRVVTVQTADSVPAFVALAASLGVHGVHLHSILPGGPEWSEQVLREPISRNMPHADLVRTWPTPVGAPEDCPRRCESPFMFIGLDGGGNVTPCRRVVGPGQHGSLTRNTWTSEPWAMLRGAMLFDRPLPDHCRGCFAGWYQ